jgi:hypothetical protein
MEDSAEVLSQHLQDIHDRIESIDSRLGDQFESVDGVTYTLRLIHGLLATMQWKSSGVASITTAAWIAAVAVVAHVVHHW